MRGKSALNFDAYLIRCLAIGYRDREALHTPRRRGSIVIKRRERGFFQKKQKGRNQQRKCPCREKGCCKRSGRNGNPARKESRYAVLCANKTRLRRAGAADKIENRRFGQTEMAGRREKLLLSGDKGGRWEKICGRVAMEKYAVIAPLPMRGAGDTA